MRVLVVTHHLAPELLTLWREAARGDVDLHLAGAVDGPATEAFEVRSALPDWAPSYGFRPRDVTRRGLLWWWYPGLGRLIRSLRPDVVHVNGEPWAVLVTQALHSGARVVAHGADNMFGHGPRAEVLARLAVARRNLRRSAAYVSWNAAGAALARTHGLPPSAPTLVAPAVLPDPAAYRGLAREERPYTVGFLGRLDPLKGVDLLLNAARAAGVERLVIGGAGPDRPRLEALGAHLAGPVPHAEVPAFLAGLDVLVVPSVTTPTGAEQFGRVVVEAMWAGTPVVVSDSGALPEVAGDGGVVVPEGDVSALAAALTGLRDPAARAALSAKGAARVRAAYDPAVVARDLLGLWSSVG
jgi:glycosyltransferase involved in cell wall biosynthesis